MKPLKFQGSGFEYFKIWIVNLVLIVLTLGLYYPWAKVRRNRYFYGNSVLEDRNFEYHAVGKQLFFSYLIALVLFIIYVIFTEFFPPAAALFLLGLFVIIPWVIVKSMMFNLKMTSFSNVRFSFEKNFSDAYLNFLLYPMGMYIGFIFVMFAVGLLFALHVAIGLIGLVGVFFFMIYAIAFLKKRNSEFYINNASYGQGKFSTTIELKEFMKISAKTLGIGLALTIALFVIVGIISATFIGAETMQEISASMQQNGDPQNSGIIVALIGAIYGGMILVMVATMAYSFALNREYIYKNTLLDENIGFSSTLKALPFMWVTVSNFFLILLTLGFGAPWAKVRVAKIVLANTYVDTTKGFDKYISENQTQTSSLGDQIGDAFDVDVGLGF
ncbi:YjgN family protein [Sulfurimonas marina]|uniref:DUF898 domain-containing protein n=1 Tax=Sulfurimonas marina TaxID=2590551 RepID=A0A7M1AZU6_9BACT|nr:YjgN family protein [Sulfurimonas marina]QOP42068.1 DUF898 domain-containing protein [Sulfurimonas marina]